ncbi:MAG: hypothetical protein AAF558_02630 [Verrucomicrobiota bacterium]
MILCFSCSRTPTKINLESVQWPTSEHHVLSEGQNHKLPLNFTVENPSTTKAHWSLNVYDWNSKRVAKQKGQLSVNTDSVGLQIHLDSQNWSYGVYDLQLSISTSSSGSPTIVRIPVVLASPHDRFIVFESEPIQRGIGYASLKSQTQNIRSKEHTTAALIARQGSSQKASQRNAYFRLTDQSLRNGSYPVMDVSAIVRQTYDTGTHLFADTSRGTKKVGMEWGRSSQWKLLRRSIDDAEIGGRISPPFVQEPNSGHDFRLTSHHEDLAIRTFWVRTYSREGELDWKRLIRFKGITTEKVIYGLAPGETEIFKHQFRNLALRSTEISYDTHLETFEGEPLWHKKGTLALTSETTTALPISVHAKPDLKFGVYRLCIKANRKGGLKEQVLNRETYIAISELHSLPRARKGDFLYGLDVAYGRPHAKPEQLDWADFMGVDIVRGTGEKPEIEANKRAIELLSEHNLKPMFMIFPEWHENDAKRERRVHENVVQLESLARYFKDEMIYYELGNEPDLKFFYGGPITEYVKGYEAYYDAIKRGNPDAIVMNAGLSFHMEEGQTRSREFVRLVNPKKIDAWAYHAHGPDLKAEQKGLNFIKNAVKEANQVQLPFIDTESGMAARTRPQEWQQARTVIEKMVFAQSVGSPTFFFFRLYKSAGGNAFTMTLVPPEPRPSVLSYRTLVSVLRHHSFTSTISLPNENSYGFFFQDNQGTGKAAVFWSADGALRTQNIDLGSNARQVEIVDMMGNIKKAPLLDSTTASLSYDRDPVFLRWKSDIKLSNLNLKPSLLELPAILQISPGKSNEVSATITNFNSKSIDGELHFEVRDTPNVRIETSSRSVQIPTGKQKQFQTELEVSNQEKLLKWPKEWSVFLEVDPKKIELSDLTSAHKRTSIASELPGKNGQKSQRRQILLENKFLEFAKLAQGIEERRAAIAIADFVSPKKQTVTVGASADWWMDVYVNGVRVYDTLEGGNISGYSLTDHTFSIDLEEGSNRIAFLVLSGSHGWKLMTGGPADLIASKGNRAAANPRLEARLFRGSNLLGKAVSRLEMVPAGFTMNKPFWDLPPEFFTSREPTLAFDPSHLRNAYEAHPDSKRWYQGAEDLSGKVWITSDSENVFIAVQIRDNEHSIIVSSPEHSDCLQLMVNDPKNRVDLVLNQKQVRLPQEISLPSFQSKSKRVIDSTFYFISWKRSGKDSVDWINMRVLDRDGDILKQHMTLRDSWDLEPGLSSPPESWFPIR